MLPFKDMFIAGTITQRGSLTHDLVTRDGTGPV